MPLHDWSLVDAGIFHDFHLTWVSLLKTRLNAGLLPDPFYALAEPVIGEAIPDVLSLHARSNGDATYGSHSTMLLSDATHPAVESAPSAVLIQDMGPPEPYALLTRQIAIRDRLRDDSVIAVIEFVSQSNKRSQAQCEQFVAKATSLLRSGIHLLVVDLQPPTRIVPIGFYARICQSYGTIPKDLPEDRGRETASYEVLSEGIVRAHVVSLAAGDVLPEMPLFLLPHQFIRLPLESTYTEAFRSLPGKFRRILEAPAAGG
jgi:hypothetical protein